VALLWNNLGSAWDSKGDYNKAIEYYASALAILEASLGYDHPQANTA